MDRDAQRRLLEKLSKAYPESLYKEDLLGVIPDIKLLNREAAYLAGHGLIEAEFAQTLSGPASLFQAVLTSDGCDFLEDDGGLGAILNTVTVKIHEDTLRALLTQTVTDSALPQSQKDRIVETVRSAPAEAIRPLLTKVLDEGMERWPAIIAAVGTL